MASNHPIDRIFREGVGNMEMKPSQDAWKQIQLKTVNTQAKFPVVRIAASVAILCVLSITVWITLLNQQSNSRIGLTVAITAPTPLERVAVTLPERTIHVEVNQPVEKKKSPNQKQVIDPIVPERLTYRYAMTAFDTYEINALETVKLVSIDPIIPNAMGVKNDQINIIYYTQATSDASDASKGKLAKIIDYARTTNPVDWVGDIRNKKDELIDNVFSLD